MASQKLIIAGVVGVIALGAFFIFSKDTTAPAPDKSATQQVTNKSDFSDKGKDSLMSLWKAGKSITCDISYAAIEQDRMEGTVYFSDERMRGDFSIVTDGGTMNTSVIQDGDTGYTWGSSPLGDMALKFTVTEEGNENQAGMPDFDEDVDYTCKKWRVDESKFIPPSDITFQEFNPTAPTFGGTMVEPFEVDCTVCANIPDPAGQAECRMVIGCE